MAVMNTGEKQFNSRLWFQRLKSVIGWLCSGAMVRKSIVVDRHGEEKLFSLW